MVRAIRQAIESRREFERRFNSFALSIREHRTRLILPEITRREARENRIGSGSHVVRYTKFMVNT